LVAFVFQSAKLAISNSSNDSVLSNCIGTKVEKSKIKCDMKVATQKRCKIKIQKAAKSLDYSNANKVYQ
jgi:hypothetical protein